MKTKILLLFFVFSFLFKTDHSFDQDLGRHLKLGEIIWQTKTIPKTNLFSYTNPDFPFINTHWLFEVFAYLGNQTAGVQALLVIKIIVLLVSVWLVLKMIPKENQALLLPIGFIFFHVLRERTELRPEIFSFFFTALSFLLLHKFTTLTQIPSDRGTFETKVGGLFLLPFIQLVWINTHIYFFVGLALQAIFLVHMTHQYLRSHLTSGKLKILGIIFSLSVIASLVNPNGLAGILYPLNVTKNYGYTIVENQTIFLLERINFRNPNFLFVKLSIAIAALSLIVTFFRKRFELKNILLTFFGITLALMNIRSFPYLVFLSLPAVLANFGAIKYNTITKFLAIIFGFLLLLESYFYLNGNYYRYKDDDNRASLNLMESGKKAMDFVLKNNLPGPIYNNFDIGSYIIYQAYPKYQIFVDGRPEAYPKDFFLNVYIPSQADYPKFKELEGKYGFKTIIFSITDQTPWGKAFLASVVKDEDWKTIYIDDFMIVLVRNYITTVKNLKIIELSKLSGDDFRFDNHRSYLNLSLFMFEIGNQRAALNFTQKALVLYPQSPTAKAFLESLAGQQLNLKF